MSFSTAVSYIWEHLNAHLRLFPAGWLFKVRSRDGTPTIRRDVQRGPSAGAQSLVANCLAQPALPLPGNHENVEITLRTPNTVFLNIRHGLLPAKLVLA